MLQEEWPGWLFSNLIAIGLGSTRPELGPSLGGVQVSYRPNLQAVTSLQRKDSTLIAIGHSPVASLAPEIGPELSPLSLKGVDLDQASGHGLVNLLLVNQANCT